MDFSYIISSFDKNPQDCTVLVGMSGGVDSSVVAALMHKAGFNVIGVTLKLNDSNRQIKSCCSDKDIQDAADVAMQMGFPHYVLDYAKSFKSNIIDNFVDEYVNGYTPSPCVRCNQKIKFGDLVNFAQKISADAVVTGHYVTHQKVNGQIVFCRPKDISKDQTYFMSLVPKSVMNIIRFPLGIYYKSEVRQIAEELRLPVAKKSDSQDLCFVQSGGYKKILEELSQKTGRGLIVDSADNVLGHHDGIHKYTIGQRKGIELPNGPWFVIEIIASQNKVIVGRKDELARESFEVDSINYMTDAPQNNLVAQVRARHDPVKCSINGNIVQLAEPAYAIAPGQICALYSGSMLVGGGRIR